MEEKEVRYVYTERVTAAEAIDALSLVFPREDVYADPDGGLVILRGSKDLLDQAESLIARLDESKVKKEVVQPGRTLLDIFKELSAELGLNLVADPALEERRLHIDIRIGNPWDRSSRSQLVPLKVETTEYNSDSRPW